MYSRKKGELVVLLVLAIFLILMGIYFTKTRGITGAVVGEDSLGLPVVVDSKQGTNLSSNLPGEEATLVNESENQSSSENLKTQDQLRIQATCNSWPCNCGDNVTESVTMSSDLTGCGDKGLVLGNHSIIFDCNHFEVRGTGVDDSIGLSFNSSNITVRNCNITSFEYGLSISSKRANITNNTLYNNTRNIDDNFNNNNVVTNNVISRNNIYNSSIGVLLYGNNNNISYNNVFNCTNMGIYAGLSDNNTVTFNNISNCSLALGVGSQNTSNISYNNFIDNGHVLDWSGRINRLNVENNWWGSTLCVNANGNLTSDDSDGGTDLPGYVDYDPILNAPYPTGVPQACEDHCRMILGVSKNLTQDFNNCSSHGVFIYADNVTLDCQGHSISGNKSKEEPENDLDGDENSGVYIVDYTIEDATIQNCNFSDFTVGIYIEDSSYHSFINNTFSCGKGIFYQNNNEGQNYVANNTFLGSNPSYSTTTGISHRSFIDIIEGNNFSHLDIAFDLREMTNVGSRTNNTFKTNFFYNNSVGYRLENDGKYWITNTFNNEQFVNNSIAILINSTDVDIGNNIFENCFFSDNSYDLKIVNGPNSNITFLNSTVNKTKLSVSAEGVAEVYWYIYVNITNQSLNPLVNSTVQSYNSLDSLEDSQLTTTSGFAQLKAREYYQTNFINYYLTPHTVIATKGNHTKNSTSVNLYNLTSANVNLSLTEISCGETLLSDAILEGNFYCNDTGFIVGKDNLSLNGQNYHLVGNGSGTGINVSNYININISSLLVTNFTTGIYFDYANNSNLTSVTIINNSQGMIINNSNDNYISDCIIASNSLNNLTLDSAIVANYTLVNISLDPNAITLGNNVTLYQKWYVNFNATYYDSDGNRLQLPLANVAGYFNNSGLLDYSTTTDDNGNAKLILSELKKNSTGITYLTPHNITLSYALTNGTLTNFTYVNLTQTNNTNINLSLNLKCTSPISIAGYYDYYINNAVSFCPGTFNVHLILNSSDIDINCDKTTFYNFFAYAKENVKIDKCIFKYDSSYPKVISPLVSLYGCNNISLVNINANSSSGLYGDGVYCSSTSQLSIINSTLNNYYDADLYYCNSSNITRNTFYGVNGLFFDYSHHSVVQNNTFTGESYGILFNSPYSYRIVSPSNNNSIYFNTFSANTHNIYYFNGTETDYTNYFNTSLSPGYAQGNSYSDYCDEGTDLNGDGYADSVSSTTANDWPYSENITTKIYDLTNDNKGVIDYGPLIQTCPAAEQYLGSEERRGGGVVTGTTAPAATPTTEAVTAPAGAVVEKKPTESFTNPEEIKKYVKSEISQLFESTEGIEGTIKVSNTGDKNMELTLDVSDSPEDTKFIVIRKTLAKENFEKFSGWTYGEGAPLGRALLSQLEKGGEEFVVPAGETLEVPFKVKTGLTVREKGITVQFKSFGEVVQEKTLTTKQVSLTGAAIDHIPELKAVDLYLVVSPIEFDVPSEKLELESREDKLTTAAITEPSKRNYDVYNFEMAINEKGKGEETTLFADTYGPYRIKRGEGFIFSQQLKYNPEVFQGINVIKTKLLREGKVIVENEFPLELGSDKNLKINFKPWSFAGILLIVVLSIFLFSMLSRAKKSLPNLMYSIINVHSHLQGLVEQKDKLLAKIRQPIIKLPEIHKSDVLNNLFYGDKHTKYSPLGQELAQIKEELRKIAKSDSSNNLFYGDKHAKSSHLDKELAHIKEELRKIAEGGK